MRVTNWALSPRGALFAHLGAVFIGGLERGIQVTLLQKGSHGGDDKRLEISLSLDEAAKLHEKIGALLSNARKAAP